ncbi:hypothetical protein BJV78DRAFT_518826 [Lactifluus subvellereus]|nr:hypothetical protein BJV78DRAFT_518826 [Lactifluus subvellereus]
MSDSPPPERPKPGSLRDRIAAFEHKPAPSPAAPPAPRPKPGNLSQWKPHAPSPPDPQPPANRADSSMSASDAKESITKAGSLKERMALLQGLGAFGGGQAAAPPPRPAEKPRWKPPPQVALAPPVTADDGEDDSVSTGGVDNKPAILPLKVPSDDIAATLSKLPPPPPAQEDSSEIEGEKPTRAEEEVDPEEEERQRRATIAARMARLGGTRVGMGPPIFGRKPEIKPKPAMPAPEATSEEPPAADVPVVDQVLTAERDVEHAQAETDVAVNVPLPTSPPINETATGTLSPQSQNAGSEYFPQQSSPSVSPNVPPRAMPVPQGPRRAPPPRKKAASKPTPPAETEAATPLLEKDTPIYDNPNVISESQSASVPALGHVEPEVGAADANADGSLSEPADENNAPLPRPVSPSSDPRPESPDTPEVDLKPRQDLPPPDDTIETAVPSSPGVPGVVPEGSEVEEALAPEPGEDETAEAAVEEEDESEDDEIAHRRRIAERVAKTGGFNPLGGQPMHSPPGVIPVEDAGTALGSQHAPMDAPAVPYSVFQQGGGANAADEDEDDEDDGKY